VITTNVRIGRAVQVNVGCVIAHDSRVGNYVTFAQSVNVAGNVTIGDDATLFTNASLIPGVQVGVGATVGAGAVVISDVAPHATVVGVPARQQA
jgi:acetyltransferase-like isoleucine patch superfamily enzyme